MRRILANLRSAVTNENVDLHLLVVMAVVFTALGILGVTDTGVTISLTLAVLAVLAYSQVRTRRHVTEMVELSRKAGQPSLLDSFPPDLDPRRANASEVLFVGNSMRTTLATSLPAFRRQLENGAMIRILLLDPADDNVMAAAHRRKDSPETLEMMRSSIYASLDGLEALRELTGGRLEVRVSRTLPSAGMNLIDPASPRGLAVIQHYEYRARETAAPIIRLEASDGFWYRHFVAEAERLWQDGAPWPIPRTERLQQAPRPKFLDDFGEELPAVLSDASELLITGVARNTLLTTHYGLLERRLAEGCKVRFLLVEPKSPAVEVAAARYYADRSPEVLRSRIRHSVSLLKQLKRATGGDLQLRLTRYPLGLGVVACRLSSTATLLGAEAILAEYYTYQARGEPKFILTRSDGRWYENLLGEAEAIWKESLAVDAPPFEGDQAESQ